MTKNVVKELPQTIVSDIEKSRLMACFDEKMNSLIQAYAKLPRHLSTDAIPRDPKNINEDKITKYVEKMKSGLNDEGQKVWNKMLSDALIQIRLIKDFINTFPNAEFVIDDNVSTPADKRIACINKEEVIIDCACIKVSEDCNKYFEKVKNLASAIKALNDYEEENNLIKTRPYGIPNGIEKICYYANHADEFAEKFMDGRLNNKNREI